MTNAGKQDKSIRYFSLLSTPLINHRGVASVVRTTRHVLLAEEVSVGTAVLHGDAVAFAAHAVARHGDGAVVVGQRGVLQHGHVPQEGVRTLLGLQTNTFRAKSSLLIG